MPTTPLMREDYDLFKQFGWPCGLSEYSWTCSLISNRFNALAAISLYPVDDCCPNLHCNNWIPLKKEYHKKAVVYTQGVGVQPAWNTSLYCHSMSFFKSWFGAMHVLKMASCSECQTSYHKNYSVGQRSYYPDFIQIGEHQFVEVTVVKIWHSEMLFGWYV